MLDPRIVRIGIEVDGVVTFYDDLDVRAQGIKYANSIQGECTVSVTGLRKEVRDSLLIDSSVFNPNRRPRRIIVEAGRKSIGASRIYEGDIFEASVGQPPNNTLTIKSKTGFYQKANVVSRGGSETISLRAIAQGVASDLGVTLDFQADDKQVGGYTFNGSADKQVKALSDVGGVSAFVDGDVLVVKNINVPVSGVVRVLNASNGMVGIPELGGTGVKATMFLDNMTKIGGGLQIESQANPALNGRYAIFKLSFDIASRAEPFYYIAEA